MSSNEYHCKLTPISVQFHPNENDLFYCNEGDKKCTAKRMLINNHICTSKSEKKKYLEREQNKK